MGSRKLQKKMKMRKVLKLEIKPQPDDTSCGPTALHSLYGYHGEVIKLSKLLEEIEQFDQGGGTLAVTLANHALDLGFKGTIYPFNYNIFDPSWEKYSSEQIKKSLEQQLKVKNKKKKFKMASDQYIEFLEKGGEIKIRQFDESYIINSIDQGNPVLTGLSSTYLYWHQREDPLTTKNDDIIGEPAGHFVIIYGYDLDKKTFLIADPYEKNPIGNNNNYYEINSSRVVQSILLGIASFDGNLLMIEK